MIKKDTHKRVVVVVIFTGYEDGTVDFTQDAPYKHEFNLVKKCFAKMQKHLATVMRDQDKCPFSPNNGKVFTLRESSGKPVMK